MWGQYLAAQKKKEEAVHASAAKQTHAGRSMQSRPPVTGVEHRNHDHSKVSSLPLIIFCASPWNVVSIPHAELACQYARSVGLPDT